MFTLQFDDVTGKTIYSPVGITYMITNQHVGEAPEELNQSIND